MIEIDCPVIPPSDIRLNILREDDSDYVFGCEEKFWNFPDSFKLCKLSGENIEWLIEAPSTNHGLILNSIRKFVYPDIQGKIMLSGAHFIPNLRNRFYLGEGPIKTTQLSLMVLDDLKRSERKDDIDFLVLIDDLYMMYDYVRLNPSTYNYYRKAFFNPLIIPPKLADMINTYKQETGNNFRVFYTTEKTMADRFNRHVKRKKYLLLDIFIHGERYKGYKSGDWFISVNGCPIQVISEHKPNCAAAIADFLKDISIITCNGKSQVNYGTLIAFFPSCSINNVIDGVKIASVFYKIKLKTYIIFTTTKCF